MILTAHQCAYLPWCGLIDKIAQADTFCIFDVCPQESSGFENRNRILGPTLAREVGRAANALRRLGVKKGDRVAIYLPMIPEAAIAMLACARIGAVHSVVFGGFSAEALRDRINDAQATVLITADGGFRRGQILPLKRLADDAVAACPSIRHVVVVRRRMGVDGGDESFANMTEGRDHWWHRLLDRESPHAEPEAMDAEDVCCSSSTPRARPASRRGSSIPPAGT